MRLKPLTIGFLILFSISLISAVTTPNTQQFTAGYEINVPQDNYWKVGQDYNFSIHVSNISDGYPITSGISCYLHVYNQSGTHMVYLETSTPSDDGDYDLFIDKGNFTYPYSGYYYAYCNSSSVLSLGGKDSEIFRVNPTGEPPTSNPGELISLLGIIFLFFCISLTFTNSKWKLKSLFIMLSLLFGVLLINTIRLNMAYSNEINSMLIAALIAGIAVVSFMFMYLLINYTIEIFNAFNKKKAEKYDYSK